MDSNLTLARVSILQKRGKGVSLFEKNESFFESSTVENGNLTLSHLQFVDDTILFSNNSWDEIRNIKRILRCFEAILGLKINFHKSVVYNVGGEGNFLNYVVAFFKCKKQNLPLKFLGLPLGASPKLKKMWNTIIEKFQSKLVNWKKKYLSFGGEHSHLSNRCSRTCQFIICLYLKCQAVKPNN